MASLTNLIPELQLMILEYLDFTDQASFLETNLPGFTTTILTQNLHRHNTNGYTLLHTAVENGYSAATDLLLAAGAPVSAPMGFGATDRGITPLLLAARHGHLRLTQKLLDHGASVDECDWSWVYALHHATRHGHIAVAQLLLSRGAGQQQTAELGTPLHIAAREGHAEIMTLLLEHSTGNIDARHREASALWFAVANGHVDCVRALLAAGANPNEEYDWVDWVILPPLLQAAIGPCGSWVCAAALETEIEEAGIVRLAGAPPRWNPTRRERFAEIVRLLLRYGADVGGEFESLCALHLAAIVGNEVAVEVLLRAGADVRRRTAQGRSAMVFARLLGHREVVRLLEDAELEMGVRKPVVKPKLDRLRGGCIRK